MSKIWIELDVISPYDNYQIIVHRLDNGVTGMLKNGALKRAERIIDLYDYSGTNHSGVYGELEIDETDFVPMDEPQQIEN